MSLVIGPCWESDAFFDFFPYKNHVGIGSPVFSRVSPVFLLPSGKILKKKHIKHKNTGEI
jgi:hypothetical protein